MYNVLYEHCIMRSKINLHKPLSNEWPQKSPKYEIYGKLANLTTEIMEFVFNVYGFLFSGLHDPKILLGGSDKAFPTLL